MPSSPAARERRCLRRGVCPGAGCRSGRPTTGGGRGRGTAGGGVRQTPWFLAPTPTPVGVAVGVAAKKASFFWNCIRLQLYRLQLYPVALFVVSGGSPTPKKALIVSRYIVSVAEKNPRVANCIRLQLYPVALVSVAVVSHCIGGGFGTCIRVSGCNCISLR